MSETMHGKKNGELLQIAADALTEYHLRGNRSLTRAMTEVRRERETHDSLCELRDRIAASFDPEASA